MTITAELVFIVPEITLLVLACIILIADTLHIEKHATLTYWLAQISLIVIIFLSF